MTFWYSFEPKKRVHWQPKDAVDYTRQTADEPSEPTDFYKTLREAHPDHPIFQDAVARKNLQDLLMDAQAAKETSPAEDGLVRQTRARGEKYATDKRVPSGESGKSSEPTDSDMEYLKDESGAAKWNASRKF